MSDPHGVVFPEVDGKRSTTALGRAVVQDALGPVDPIGAAAAARATNWRQDYVGHFRRLVEAGLDEEADAVAIARAGLTSLHSRMQTTTDEGAVPVAALFEHAPAPTTPIGTVTLTGGAPARTELTVPMRGRRLGGADLQRQLDDWQQRGILEPSAAEAVRAVAANPQWLRLEGRRVVVLGAAAEMGPLRALLSWGADVVGVDLPRADVWNRILGTVRENAGTLTVPVADARDTEDGLAARAGGDLLHGLAPLADWIEGIDGSLVLGNYVYADGETNVRVATAVDVLSVELARRRPGDLSLAFLATPTDTFGVPGAAVDHSATAYGQTSGLLRLTRPALRAVTGGRLLRRNYAPGSDPGLNDSVVPQQGPNYLLAKRLQRWRATVARRDGIPVSLKVAPPTRTRSVVKNRALAAAYAGAHPFGIEVFEPATSNTLMAALLVHDLCTSTPAPRPPWQEEADAAVHGGLWRGPYDPRSALGLAVVLGLGSART